jgi:hypothetical protein
VIRAAYHSLTHKGLEQAGVDRAWVLNKLKDNCLSAMAEKNRTAANRALELLGKEQGMFRDALDVKNT